MGYGWQYNSFLIDDTEVVMNVVVTNTTDFFSKIAVSLA